MLESGVPTAKKGKGDSGSYGRLFIARKEKWNNIYCISIVNWETLWFLHTFHFMSSFLGRLMGNDWAEHQGRVCCCRVRGWNLDFNTVLLRFNYTLYYTPCLSKQYRHLLFSKGRMTVKRTRRDSAGPRGLKQKVVWHGRKHISRGRLLKERFRNLCYCDDLYKHDMIRVFVGNL